MYLTDGNQFPNRWNVCDRREIARLNCLMQADAMSLKDIRSLCAIGKRVLTLRHISTIGCQEVQGTQIDEVQLHAGSAQ